MGTTTVAFPSRGSTEAAAWWLRQRDWPLPDLPSLSGPRVRSAASLPEAVETAPELKARKLAKPATLGLASAKVVRSTPQAAPATPAMLEIEVEHKFAEAHLAIWVDDSLSFTHQLEGAEKKHLVVFRSVQGHEFHAVQIAPGKHNLRVQVTSEKNNFDQSATVAGDFATGAEKLLRVQFSKSGQMSLSLE